MITKVLTINLRTKSKFPKKLQSKKFFHEHFCSDDYNGIEKLGNCFD